jgi:SAM-dependent methyltransferase
MTSIQDPIGSAIIEYLSTKNDSYIKVESNLTEEDEIPLAYLFRTKDQLPQKEVRALSKVQGRTLDVGAGAGAHSLILQQENKNVVALDISEKCCDAMKLQGIINVICADFFNFKDAEKFDTILLLMNGFGIAGTLENLPNLLEHCKSLLKPGGIIIGESADILYLFEEDDGSCSIDLNSNYYGEMRYRMSHNNVVGEWFDWLYVSSDLVSDCAETLGFKVLDVEQGENDDFIIYLKKTF